MMMRMRVRMIPRTITTLTTNGLVLEWPEGQDTSQSYVIVLSDDNDNDSDRLRLDEVDGTNS